MLSGSDSLAGGGRRFLLSGVVSRYQLQPSWNREELTEDLQRMVDLFNGELGYQYVPVMGLNPTAWQIQDALREFCASTDRQADDYVVVYLAGHGEILSVGDAGFEHVLLPADASPDDLRRRVVKSADLAEWMLADTPVRRLLLIVDACYSGMGGLDFARNALARIGTPARLTQTDGSGVVVVTATQAAQQGIPGAFTTAFARAIRSQATAGHAPGTLSIDAVINVLRNDPELPASQQAQWSLLAGSGTIPEFLPNPRRDAALVDLDLDEQDRRWRARLALEHQRAEEMRGQFVPRTVGFTGRHRAVADVTRWLETSARAKPMIVTGDPGSGKTAVLGLLAALSDPHRRPTVPRDGLPTDGIPDEDAIDVAIYAGNLTTGQILAGLAAAADIDEINPDPAALGSNLTRLLTGLRGRDRPLVAMIDALDESTDPQHLAEQLLRPLIDRGRGVIRLLLGTRRLVCDHLGRGWRERCDVIDLDGTVYADPIALAAYVRRILTGSIPGTAPLADGSPFANCPQTVLAEVTGAIADAAGHSFFVARILASTQASQPVIPNLADPAWRDGLPRTAGPAMRRDLETRLGDQSAKAVDLLRPLAYAQGSGLPWEDIWALLANALAPGHHYNNEDLVELAGHAGSFIVESGAISGRSLYRLYHRSLAEDLTAGRGQDADHFAITKALTAHVPRRSNGRPDWQASHPYIRANLATHAARGGSIDALVQDPGFLLGADPPLLLAALHATNSTTARQAADAYRSALPALRRHPVAEHAAYLCLAARCSRADDLGNRIEADGLNSTWRARWASWQPQRPHQRITGHDGGVQAVATAELDGGRIIVSGGADGTVRRWDLTTGTPIGGPIIGHDGSVNAVAVGELDGGPVIISGGADGTVRRWDLTTGTPIGDAITGHGWAVSSVAVGELDGGPVIISGGADGTVRRWDLTTGTPIGGPITGHDGSVNAVAVGELEGRPVIISGGADETVRRWDLASTELIGDPIEALCKTVNAVAAAELDGRPVIISGNADGTVRRWDLASGIPIGDPITGHGGEVNSVGVGQLGDQPVIISGGWDATVRVWDLATGTPIGAPITGHTQAVNAVAVAELDAQPVIISGSDDQTIRVWDLATSVLIRDLFTGHTGPVNAVAVAELDGQRVIISGSGETIRVWDLATITLIDTPIRYQNGRAVAMAAAELDGRPVIISGSSDQTIRVWNLATGTPVGAPITGHTQAVNAVAVAELDAQPVIISGSSDQTIRVWDLATGTPIGDPITGHDRWVNAVTTAESDGRPVIISGSSDQTIRVWDLATGTPIGDPITGHDGSVNAVTTAESDGRPVIISGSSDQTIRVWDLATGTPIGDPITGHDGSVNAVTTAESDGRPVIISGSSDQTIRVWDLATGTPIGDPITGHDGSVNAVTTAESDGRPVIISGSSDQTIRVWDLAAGTPFADPPTGHTKPVNTVATSEIRSRPVIISGSSDRTIRVWDLATSTLIADPIIERSGPVNTVALTEMYSRPVIISGSDDATVRVWDLATGYLYRQSLTGHAGQVNTVAVAEIAGQAVIVSGSDDATVRVWDLATATPIGDPLTGHAGRVNTVAVAEIAGQAVIVSGSDDATVRVWDLATATPIGDPLTGHAGRVNTVAVAEIAGQAVIVSGSDDATVRVWDLATATPIGDPLISLAGPVISLAVPIGIGSRREATPSFIAIGTENKAIVLRISGISDGIWQTHVLIDPDVSSQILALAWADTRTLALATELGVLIIEVPSIGQLRR